MITCIRSLHPSFSQLDAQVLDSSLTKVAKQSGIYISIAFRIYHQPAHYMAVTIEVTFESVISSSTYRCPIMPIQVDICGQSEIDASETIQVFYRAMLAKLKTVFCIDLTCQIGQFVGGSYQDGVARGSVSASGIFNLGYRYDLIPGIGRGIICPNPWCCHKQEKQSGQ